MTAKTAAPGRGELSKPQKTMRRYAVALVAALIPALLLHSLPLAILGVVAVLAVAVIRARKAWQWRQQGGKAAKRSRAQFQGTATPREIRRKLSPGAARKRARATCPDLHPSEAHVTIGRTTGRPSREIADNWSGSRLVYAPPQTLKTALTACWASDVPGAAMLYSSRCDQYDHTVVARAARGPVWVLNADGEGGIPTNFGWCLVDGCQAQKTAMRRAGNLMAAAPRDPSGKDAHWDALSKDMLQYLLKAAAFLPGGNILTVRRWSSNPLQAGQAAEILSQYDPDWGEALVAMVSTALNDDRYWSAISQGVRQALSWLDDDDMKAVACPAPGQGIDLRGFIEDGTGTIYVIGADREHGSLAPYFAAFGAEAFHVARSVAEAQPRRRLRRPFVIVADEAATIVPLPWDKITAVSSGYNIGITACFQADSQITERWGEARAKTIRTNFTVKVIGPGFTDPGELEALSAICGERDTWEHSDAKAGNSHARGGTYHAKERLFPPERIRLLADWHALVLHRNARPVEVKVTPVWKRRGYQRVTPDLVPVPQPGRPALEAAPARVFVTPAASRPAVTEPDRIPELAATEGEVTPWVATAVS